MQFAILLLVPVGASPRCAPRASSQAGPDSIHDTQKADQPHITVRHITVICSAPASRNVVAYNPFPLHFLACFPSSRSIAVESPTLPAAAGQTACDGSRPLHPSLWLTNEA